MTNSNIQSFPFRLADGYYYLLANGGWYQIGIANTSSGNDPYITPPTKDQIDQALSGFYISKPQLPDAQAAFKQHSIGTNAQGDGNMFSVTLTGPSSSDIDSYFTG